MAATPTLWPWEIGEDAEARSRHLLGWLDDGATQFLGLLQSRHDVVNRHEEQHLVLETLYEG